ncbi:MAG TPA: FecR family protein [Gallionella sp.]
MTISEWKNMRSVNQILILCASLLGLAASCAVYAGDTIEIVRAEGTVETGNPDQPTRTPVKTKSTILSKNIVTTGPDGRAVIKVGDSGYIVVEKNSTVEIGKSSNNADVFRQVTGMIFYALNAIRGKQQPAEIRTATATIGIRGTRFLVADLPDRKEIGMRKGLISVASPDEAYEIYRKTQEDEFAAFKKEAQDAINEEKRKFSEYKADTEREFVAFKREFALAKDRMVSFDGRRVTEGMLSGKTKEDMESLEAYAAEWLKDVRD